MTRATPAASMPTKDTLYYDGGCGLCLRSKKWLTRLDWLGRLAFADMLSVPEAELPVPMEAALKGIPMRTKAGGVLIGEPAMRRALLQTPVGFLPALVMGLPGINRISVRVYNYIARNRARRVCEVER